MQDILSLQQQNEGGQNWQMTGSGHETANNMGLWGLGKYDFSQAAVNLGLRI